MTRILMSIHDAVWGIPMLILILWVGLQITVKTGFVQFRLFPEALSEFLRKFRVRNHADGVSPFRALCTALGATVGTGNIVGVAGAVCLGGPGAVFWMWVCGLIAMGTKFAEATMAVRYHQSMGGETVGGPMYMIHQGMGEKWRGLAVMYCCFGAIASFGVGNMAQVNAVISGINSVLTSTGGVETLRRNLGIGLVLSVILGSVLMGGASRIGVCAEWLVPAASLLYIFLCATVLFLRRDALGTAFRMIFQGACTPQAVTGGAVGTVFAALRVGCSRGVFTNEAGMGTASMAHASAQVDHPVEQGLMGMIEVFLDTIVLCTLTALVILVSGVPVSYGVDSGGTLTLSAFSHVLGNGAAIVLTAAICCFAFVSVLGWGLYGMRCVQFLFGASAWEPFAAAQILVVILGAVLHTETIWLLSELFNGLMAVPNLIILAVLTPELSRLTKEYKKKSGGSAAEGGHYANFHQCQPLRAFPHEKVPSLRGGSGKAGEENLSSEHWTA